MLLNVYFLILEGFLFCFVLLRNSKMWLLDAAQSFRASSYQVDSYLKAERLLAGCLF